MQIIMRKLFYLSLVLTVGLASCSKDRETGSDDPTKSAATSMQNLKIPADFDWNPTQMVTINVEAAPVYFDQPNQMVVKNEAGQIIMTATAKMTESTTLNFELAKSERTVTVEYGSIIRVVNVASGTGVFSYIDAPDAETNDSEEPQFDEKELEPIILD